MASLEDELRSDARCGCYADGAGSASRPAVSHHCVTCRAADRIEVLEAALRDIIKTADDFHAEHGIAMGGWETTRALNHARMLVQ